MDIEALDANVVSVIDSIKMEIEQAKEDILNGPSEMGTTTESILIEMSDNKKDISEFFREIPPFLKIFNITRLFRELSEVRNICSLLLSLP